MCLWIDEFSEVLSYTTPRARKEHTCEECSRTIEWGEQYHRWACLEEGDFITYKMCAHCRSVVTVGADLTGCPEQWFWGRIMDHQEDDGGFVGDIIHHDNLPAGTVVRMLRYVVLSRRGWRDRAGQLVPTPA